MPQIPTAPDQKPAAVKHKPLLVPPEEQFWKRYSPHNEFQLSNATSIALHVIAIGLILLIAWIIDQNRDQKSAKDYATLDPVVMAEEDSSGSKKGGGGGGGTDGGSPNLPKENVGNSSETTNTEPTEYKGPALVDANEAPPVEVAKDGVEPPPLTTVQKNLRDIGKQAQRTLQQAQAASGKDKGRPGKDGGRNGGVDKGTGGGKDKGVGRGPPGEAARRAQRQLRWRLVFNRNSDGPDYRDKLKALDAILVVAEFKPGGGRRLQYRLVIRDIKARATVRQEDVSKIRGIFWIDDRPESVAALARALGLRGAPPLFACFFPEKVENELRRLEKRKYNGPEEDIFETHFHVELRGREYQLICDEVKLKNE